MSANSTIEITIPDGVWSVDRETSEIGFQVNGMWGLQTVRGQFGSFDGRLDVQEGRAGGELTIDSASLDTELKKRDQHLRSEAFFDVEHHPQIRFTTTAVTARPGGLTVSGDLIIGSSRVRLDVPVEVAP